MQIDITDGSSTQATGGDFSAGLFSVTETTDTDENLHPLPVFKPVGMVFVVRTSGGVTRTNSTANYGDLQRVSEPAGPCNILDVQPHGTGSMVPSSPAQAKTICELCRLALVGWVVAGMK